ncbi:MAG TPA: hypothetical protein VFN56_05320 [Candidatus Saccharimonadales bacterium]|nr:hypothetical protein [Candidatus Saccharimonadales bacterium]
MKLKLLNRNHVAGLAVLLSCVSLTASSLAAPLQSVVQSYIANTSLQKGMIVKLTGKDDTQVTPDTQSTAQQMTGVVVDPSDAAVTLAPSVTGSQQQVYVATSGRYNVLVSTQNGAIASGDFITISSLAGVGMKAGSDQSEVLGKAAMSFDGVHNVIGSTSVKDQNGKLVTVSLARIAVDIIIGPNPLVSKASNVPGLLSKASALITNKQVAAWRIYLATAVLAAALILAGILLYGGVRSGMVAIGRNPLARSSIIRNLLQVIIMSVIVFMFGLFSVYLLLKL